MPRGNPFEWQQVTILLIVFVSLTVQAAAKDNPSNVQITRNIASMPLAFTANQGQWDDEVLFRANTGGATMWFSPDGAYYQFTRTIESSASQISSSYPDVTLSGQSPAEGVEGLHEPDSVETMMIKASFVGANLNPHIIGVNMIDYKCNYFIGNDPNKWQTDVPNYSAVMYEEIYGGIDLKYYGNGTQMEYDFIVSPGADYSQIKIQYEGAESISINDNGELVVTTKWGEVIEQRPVIYQIENNNRIQIDGKYLNQSDNSFGFEISGYNPALPLVIDPVLSYSTYLGGSDNEIGQGIAVDASGAAYVIGITISTDFPTFNPYQGTFQGSTDAFVTKLSSSGNSLIYSTYLGGSDFEDGQGITVDASGAAYITGETDSPDFPILNAFQGTFQGINDAYVAKLNSSGGLVYSTYLGGTNYDFALGIAIDDSGAAYVTGTTYSTDFPMLNPYQGTHLGGLTDIFVTKLNIAGDSLVYSTYLGGSHTDDTYDIAVDASGSAYITGWTRSVDFPTLNPFQDTLKGKFDVFVTKFSSSGNSLVYSTYLGGSSDNDYGHGIAVDATGAAYVTGETDSPDFPMFNAYQGTYQGGTKDVFVTKISSSGDSLVYSTYLGGSGRDVGFGISIDSSGVACIAGNTSSSDFPMLNPYQGTYQGISDVFVTKLSSSGGGLVYSTYLGGADVDNCFGLAVDTSGAAYVTGYTWSTDFPTLNPYQGTHQVGLIDAFVTKFSEESPSCCVGNRGDLNGDGDNANILDLTFLVDYIFRGSGVPGSCPEESDVNGDGDSANILDLTYLVDFIFRGGPAPGPC
ncbi:MAG: SBBP repeat-containing protein [candidate division Zixibacteria bacterium]